MALLCLMVVYDLCVMPFLMIVMLMTGENVLNYQCIVFKFASGAQKLGSGCGLPPAVLFCLSGSNIIDFFYLLVFVVSSSCYFFLLHTRHVLPLNQASE
jgi:hypothetical protein